MPGLRWLLPTFAAQGVSFDSVFAWEMKPHPGDEFFKGMTPGELAKTAFYNFPVSATKGDLANPLEVLRAAARPDDYVVLKVDIDTVDHLELALVKQLLADPGLLALVDELYWEDHFNSFDMLFWAQGGVMMGSMHDSATLFQRLRRAGVRASVWP